MRLSAFQAAFAVTALCAAVSAEPAATPPPAAQRHGPDLAAQRAAMDRIADMAGDWAGEVDVMFPIQRRVFQTEHIERDMNGLLLVIHGQGFAARNHAGDPVFTAFGVISYDDRRGIYEFRVYNDGNAATAEARFLDDGRMQWTMNFAPVQIRYTITRDEGHWNEIGEMSRDNGATWSRTVEMNLVKAH